MQSLWNELVGSRAFWVGYVSAGVSFTGCASLRGEPQWSLGEPHCGGTVTFVIPGGFLLTFDVRLGEHTLLLRAPDGEAPMTVGTMDSHQMSDLFRWDEFLIVSRALTAEIRPTWAVDLLLLFYVAVTADHAAEHSARLRDCLTASAVFTAAEVDHIVRYSERVAVRADFRWVADPARGWVAEGRDAYCMRHTRGGFDFETFKAFMLAIDGA